MWLSGWVIPGLSSPEIWAEGNQPCSKTQWSALRTHHEGIMRYIKLLKILFLWWQVRAACLIKYMSTCSCISFIPGEFYYRFCIHNQWQTNSYKVFLCLCILKVFWMVRAKIENGTFSNTKSLILCTCYLFFVLTKYFQRFLTKSKHIHIPLVIISRR